MSSVFCELAMTVPHIVSDMIWDAEMSDAVTTIETAVPLFRFKLDKYKLKGYNVSILTIVHLLVSNTKCTWEMQFILTLTNQFSRKMEHDTIY